jgi:hypothetical protein
MRTSQTAEAKGGASFGGDVESGNASEDLVQSPTPKEVVDSFGHSGDGNGDASANSSGGGDIIKTVIWMGTENAERSETTHVACALCKGLKGFGYLEAQRRGAGNAAGGVGSGEEFWNGRWNDVGMELICGGCDVKYGEYCKGSVVVQNHSLLFDLLTFV